MEDNLLWVNEAIPVFNDRLLPAIWPVTILTNVGVKEVCIGDNPGLIIKGEMWQRR